MTGRGKGGKGLGKGGAKRLEKCSAITSRASPAGYPSSRSQGRRETYIREAPASQRRQPDFRAFDTVYSGVPRPIYRNATIERLKPNRNFYFGPRHRSRIRFESLKSREGQVKSCNNVDEKRSVGREALITVYPTVREVVDSGASRFAYLAFVRICIRRVPRIRSTGADDSRRRGETEGYRGRWRRRCRQAEGETDASEDFRDGQQRDQGAEGRSGSSLQAIKKYIAAQYKVDAEKHAPFIRKYLKSAVESGTLIQTKGRARPVRSSSSLSHLPVRKVLRRRRRRWERWSRRRRERAKRAGSKSASSAASSRAGGGGKKSSAAAIASSAPRRKRKSAAAAGSPTTKSKAPTPKRGRRRRRGRSGCRLRRRRRSPPPPPRRRRRRPKRRAA
ncbi:Histone H1B [Eumeta japonica]|uniref:Histone H1B n=1 Tax=Eumeta variegata TaxID=151549 RepID=A0A4C1ZKP7_EUMVA|nr:Histone H1B [Eumeta japonica]